MGAPSLVSNVPTPQRLKQAPRGCRAACMSAGHFGLFVCPRMQVPPSDPARLRRSRTGAGLFAMRAAPWLPI